MKTCVYARKSTNKLGQKETIENQIDICKRHSSQHGLEIVDIKVDVGTGTDDINRPEVKALVQEAIAGKYQCVIMKGISRFYRDVEKGLALLKQLNLHNIRVITLEESFDSFENRTGTGKLDTSRITMYLMFAEMESKKTGDRVKYTQIERARKGLWNVANPPFGYTLNRETMKLEINHLQAEVVRLIFNLYLSGLGIRVIANYLDGNNDEGRVYKAPRTEKWKSDTVAYILKNRAYAGSIVYNKRSVRENLYKRNHKLNFVTRDSWVGNVLNEEDQWIVVDNAHEAIVSLENFEKVQNLLSIKTSNKGIRGTFSLFAGLMKCGECGTSMIKKVHNRKHVYMCKQYVKKGVAYCKGHYVLINDIEALILNEIKAISNDNYMILKTALEGSSAIHDSGEEKKKIQIQGMIQSVSDKMDKLLEKNLDGVVDDRQYKLMNAKYANELEELTNDLEKIISKELNSGVKNIQNEEEHYVQLLDSAAKYDTMDLDAKRMLFAQLVDSIEVKYNKPFPIVDVQFNFEN